MNVNKYDGLTYSLQTVGSHVKKGGTLKPSHFRVEGSGDDRVLKTNSLFRRIILAPYYHSQKHTQEVDNYLQHMFSSINNNGREVFVNNPKLLSAIQRYDQSVVNAKKNMASSLDKALSKIPSKLLNKKETNEADLEELIKYENKIKDKFLKGRIQLPSFDKSEISKIPEIQGLKLNKVEFLEPPIKQLDDQPTIVTEKRFGANHKIRRYQTDVGIDHMHEAGNIFKSTQAENLLNGVGKVLRACGFKAQAFEKYRYKAGAEGVDIYATDAPMIISENPQRIAEKGLMPQPRSYWLGHATLLLEVPLRSEVDPTKTASIRVITDPVEGDLNKILYPRKTKFAKPMDEIPAPQVYLLSHNHLDHYSASTIKKLLSQQPFMIVPKGDGERYSKMGFEKVQELDWWEGSDLTFKQDNEEYRLTVRAVPARHWAGQGPCGGHASTFLGYIIEGHEDGGIYFAGDTAPLDYKRDAKPMTAENILKLREFVKKRKKEVKNLIKQMNATISSYQKDLLQLKIDNYEAQAKEARQIVSSGKTSEYSHIQALREFKPRYYFAPGGPDEVRADMETTHQCSAYSLQAHVEIMLQGIDSNQMTKEQFLQEALQRKTVLMHTMTFKLGSLKLMDTPDSLSRVLQLLMKSNEIDNLKREIEDLLEKKCKEKHPDKQVDDPKRIKYKASIRDKVIREVTADIRPNEATVDQKWRCGLRSYEWDIVENLINLAGQIKLKDGEQPLTPRELALLLNQTVTVPKIGSNLGLRTPFANQEEKLINRHLS
jgi:L-ascorbate metabolism protein UlaG (beta-lactamase superfamily)